MESLRDQLQKTPSLKEMLIEIAYASHKRCWKISDVLGKFIPRGQIQGKFGRTWRGKLLRGNLRVYVIFMLFR